MNLRRHREALNGQGVTACRAAREFDTFTGGTEKPSLDSCRSLGQRVARRIVLWSKDWGKGHGIDMPEDFRPNESDRVPPW